MSRVTLELPTVLAQVVEGKRSIAVEAQTLRSALERAFDAHPALRVHIFDESGNLREHVLCFHNDVNSRWREQMDARLADGDRITILQAVSGG